MAEENNNETIYVEVTSPEVKPTVSENPYISDVKVELPTNDEGHKLYLDAKDKNVAAYLIRAQSFGGILDKDLFIEDPYPHNDYEKIIDIFKSNKMVLDIDPEYPEFSMLSRPSSMTLIYDDEGKLDNASIKAPGIKMQ